MANAEETAVKDDLRHPPRRKKKKKKITAVTVAQIVFVIALLIYMEVAVKHKWVNPVFLAAPSDIIKEGIKITKDGTLFPHLIISLEEVLAGFGLGALTGIAVGLIWTLFPKIEEFMSPFCSAIMAIPKVAILPLLILWFGIGFKSKLVLIFLFTVFTILFNTVGGAKQCSEEYLKVARVFETGRVKTVFRVVLPYALTSIFTGLKLSAATAMTGVVFSEMQSAKKGLGYLLAESQNFLNTKRLFFLVILVTVLSVLFVKLFKFLEYITCHKWRKV
ncbi:MAG: ABC transporter permease [Lachnospiraceae bacterium]|nr:ABC transporter permease [Lachnospiraceae bacterium]